MNTREQEEKMARGEIHRDGRGHFWPGPGPRTKSPGPDPDIESIDVLLDVWAACEKLKEQLRRREIDIAEMACALAKKDAEIAELKDQWNKMEDLCVQAIAEARLRDATITDLRQQLSKEGSFW